MRRTFYLTLVLFLLVWGFSAIDRIGAKHSRNTAALGSLPEFEPEDLEKQIAAVLESESQAISSESTATQNQVDEIDRQIQELKGMKRGFEARALRHDDQAQRLQFEDRAVLESRRHIELADENRAKAERVQQEINRLQSERQKLLQSR